jgi:anthranilate phosphoribosyltransferase
MKLRDMLERLLQCSPLDEDEAVELLRMLVDGDTPPAVVAALLAALRAKGVSVCELRGLVTALRAMARRPELPPHGPLIDIVGTGGDASGSLNLSTGAALLVAAMGGEVVKHGTASVSSRSGSADVMRALGVPLPLDEQASGECLASTGFTFLFAPHYHPALKAVMPIRQLLGVRTVFNILGPLLNPAAPAYCLIGAYSLQVAQLMAQTLAGLPIERAYVVYGEPGWDEATPVGPFMVFDVHRGCVSYRRRSASEFGLPPCSAQELAGADPAHNAASLRAVLSGQEQGAHRDALVLQAALVWELTGRATAPRVAAAAAQECLDCGGGQVLLDKLEAFAARRRARSTIESTAQEIPA